MAKESMKAREVKRAKMVARYDRKRANFWPKVTMKRSSLFLRTLHRCACITVAKLPVAPRDTCDSLAFPVFSSAKWLRKV